MKLGTNNIKSVYLGTNAVQKVYLGTNEVWSSYAYLLDDYSGAAAAYSLRKLRSSYTGSAIRVRRASDNTEQDIGFVNNELDTSTLASFCSGTDGFVKTWYDQSGNGYNATQSTAASQPQIVSSGSVILENAKPCLQFDGIDDNFNQITTALNLGSFIFVGQTVANSTSATIWGSLSGVGNAFPSALFLGAYTSTLSNESIGFVNGDGGGGGPGPGLVSDITTFDDEQLLISAYFGSSSGSIFKNNTSANLILNNYGLRTLDYQIGKRINLNQFYNKKMQEIIIYSTSQSSNNSGINTNINNYYSIY